MLSVFVKDSNLDVFSFISVIKQLITYKFILNVFPQENMHHLKLKSSLTTDKYLKKGKNFFDLYSFIILEKI